MCHEIDASASLQNTGMKSHFTCFFWIFRCVHSTFCQVTWSLAMRPQESRDENINRKSAVSFDFARILSKKVSCFQSLGKKIPMFHFLMEVLCFHRDLSPVPLPTSLDADRLSGDGRQPSQPGGLMCYGCFGYAAHQSLVNRYMI